MKKETGNAQQADLARRLEAARLPSRAKDIVGRAVTFHGEKFCMAENWGPPTRADYGCNCIIASIQGIYFDSEENPNLVLAGGFFTGVGSVPFLAYSAESQTWRAYCNKYGRPGAHRPFAEGRIELG